LTLCTVPGVPDDSSGVRERQITAVLFDLGNVLIRWDRRNLYTSLIHDEAELDWFLDNVVTMAWNAQLDAGRPFDEAVAELQAEHPEHAELIAAFRDRWIETLGDPLHETVELLHALQGNGVATYALTNWSAETFPLARDRFPFLDTFGGIVVSGAIALAKPDPAIFRHTLEAFGLEPATTLFVDDSAANIAAARELGFAVEHFTGAEPFEATLRAHGLLP
jgi:2-haloacid dehalogenase